MIKNDYTAEMGFILGDAITEFEEHAVLDAMADESELTENDLDDWYASLIIEHENYEDHRDKS